MKEQPLSLDDVERNLSGHGPATSQAASVIDSTLRAIIAKEYQHVRSELSLRRFSFPDPDGTGAAPADGKFQVSPLPDFCDAIVTAGFADYNVFSEPVVRAVPLFIRHEGRLYPQFALAVACRLLDADLAQATITKNRITIPTSSGAIHIPVRQRYSETSGRYIGGIMDIPWFGENEWMTMYDWPEHRQIVQHYPIDVVWSIVEIRRRLAANNRTIDNCIKILLTEAVNKRAAEEYAARQLPIEDFTSRSAVAEKVLSDLREVGMDDPALLGNIETLPEAQRFVVKTMASLRAALEQNRTLDPELQLRRREVSDKLRGKAVFVGAVATATGDFVTTSLHARCPGVVVHGVIVNAIVNRDFLCMAPPWATLLLTLMFGLLATAITARLPPARGLLLLGLIAALYFAANGLLFFDRLNVILDAAAPLVAIGACWGGSLVTRQIVEIRERIRLRQEAAVLDHEISLARQVQAALIPKELNILTKVQSHGWTLAATTTGGDCFDLWKLADGRLGILVADASGHGLGPSIIVSEVRALVRALCDLYTEPQQLLERVNTRIAADLQGTKFCTTFVGFLDEEGKLSWGSAGHGPMLWAPTRDAEPIELQGTALPLGVSDQWLGDETVPPLQMEPGGWLAVVSDGIFEAPDPTPKGDQFGIERVREAIAKCRDGTCEQVVDAIRTAVQKWQVVAEPADDQTVVFIRVLGSDVTNDGGAGAAAQAVAEKTTGPATAPA
jgi:serine phosphatase RsbU (regulator of sigma subunit)